MKIEKIKIKNYKVFQDVEITDISNMAVFLGANGSGKSTLFDVFGFLSDSLKSNVKKALDKRGGFKEVISRNQKGNIEFEIKFRNDVLKGEKQPLTTYTLNIGLKDNKPVIEQEILTYRRGKYGRPYKFLDFSEGSGSAIINEDEYKYETASKFKDQRESQTLDSPDILAIKGLGQFKKFEAISSFRKLLENWYISNFQIEQSKMIQDASISEHLSTTGDNLSLVTQYIHENYPEIFDKILKKMEKRVPGVSKVEAKTTDDGRVILKFHDGSFKDPFIARYVSDGTLKMFAYLVLLNNPEKHPLLCIEEPENFLHPDLLIELAEEFREYANNGGQVFISSHSPDFINNVELEELFWLTKENGYTQISKAKDDRDIKNLVETGDKLGYLWNQGYLKGSGPKK